MRGAAVAVLIVAASCGSELTGVSTADPLHELITLDQLTAPGFTVLSPATHVGAATLAGGDAVVESALTAGGLQSAASVEFQRTIDFGTSNGPIDVVATVERFAGTGGASTAYSTSVRRLDAVQGAVPTSTGPLGDQAHSISVVRTAPDGLQAVEITVVWRVANLVNIIIARGRYGGTRLADALVLAGVQTQNESAIGAT